MKTNGYMGQLVGPFKAKEELFDKIQEDAYVKVEFVNQIGIQVEKDTIVYINKKPVQVGRTGIYEIGNTEITSIYFEADTDKYAIIDYTIYESEEI